MPTVMKGLTVFVADVRNAPNQEAEERRVQQELAKIRIKYSQNKKLSSYDRKKYMWKLLYSYMLGYEIDFGHIQVGVLLAHWLVRAVLMNIMLDVDVVVPVVVLCVHAGFFCLSAAGDRAVDHLVTFSTFSGGPVGLVYSSMILLLAAGGKFFLFIV